MKNIDDLIRAHYAKNPNGHYFDPDTLKWFGERRSDMRLLKGTVKIKDVCENLHEAYVISRLQRNHPNGPRRTRAYFDTTTLQDVIIKND